MQDAGDVKEKRITVIVPEDLHHKARLKSVQTGKSISEVVREALRAWTANETEAEK